MNALNSSAVETVNEPARDSRLRRSFAVLALLLAAAPGIVIWQHASSSLESADATTQLGALSAGDIQVKAETPLQREQRLVSEFLARRYRVSEQALDGIVATAYGIGRELAVDPLLILSVAAVESRFNPLAESVFGAQGLMQIIPRFHAEKLRRDASLFDADTNIRVGARILKEYLRRGGDLQTALELYGGVTEEGESQYANKVLSERSRLEQTVQRVRRSG